MRSLCALAGRKVASQFFVSILTFPSGTDIHIGFLELDGNPTVSLAETSRAVIFDLALCPKVKDNIREEVFFALREKVYIRFSCA